MSTAVTIKGAPHVTPPTEGRLRWGADPWSNEEGDAWEVVGPGIRIGMVSITITACGRALPSADPWSCLAMVKGTQRHKGRQDQESK